MARAKLKTTLELQAKKGLKEIAITDHGFNHQLYNVMRKDIPLMRRQIEELKDKYNVKILLGVEANLISSEGDIDVEHKDEEKIRHYFNGFS